MKMDFTPIGWENVGELGSSGSGQGPREGPC
jgi:hypothetical protein